MSMYYNFVQIWDWRFSLHKHFDTKKYNRKKEAWFISIGSTKKVNNILGNFEYSHVQSCVTPATTMYKNPCDPKAPEEIEANHHLTLCCPEFFKRCWTGRETATDKPPAFKEMVVVVVNSMHIKHEQQHMSTAEQSLIARANRTILHLPHSVHTATYCTHCHVLYTLPRTIHTATYYTHCHVLYTAKFPVTS